MRFGVLGPIAAWTDDGTPVHIPDRKVRALLADLLLHAGHPVATSRLIDDLWGDDLPANPTATLQTRVSQLRRALGDAEPEARHLVRTQQPGYLIAVPQEAIDAGRFRMLLTRARQTSRAQMRAATLADALGLWRGPAYAEVGEQPFARAAVDRLAEERLATQEAFAEVRLQLGEHDDLSAELGELVSTNPTRQRLRAVHLQALYRAGRQIEALDSYAEFQAHLADDLGLDPSPELVELHRAILNNDSSLAAAQVGRRGNLPAQMSALIGRSEAVSDVVAGLEASRIVTLIGAGGVGKTSLALAAARELTDNYSAGTWLVELAALDDTAGPDDVRQAITAAVDEAAWREMPDRATLIVIDNCEHVIDAAAAAVVRLLQEYSQVRVLVTSREPLAVPGEHRIVVPPLDLPSPGADTPEILAASAVELFAARAAAADATFSLTADNADAVAEICRRLDGLPLALELAAGRASAMDVSDLAARLDDRFRLLTGGRRGVPERQQTLEAVVEWSWNLLKAPERVVLRRLALHPGGCTLAAAEAVCAGDDAPIGDVADILGRLVERSLVVRTNTTSGSRYRLLETVRAFCMARLREADELDGVRRRYKRYFEGLAANTEPRLYGHSALFAYLGGLYSRNSITPGQPASTSEFFGAQRYGVLSADGTRLVAERYGQRRDQIPPVILVGGALNDRRAFVPLARRLQEGMVAVTYDRRGRGDSDDTQPYDVQREIDDLAAVVDSVGGEAVAFGVSSGAVLVAEAAARGVPIIGLVLVEPPFILDDSRTPMPTDFAAQLTALVEAGRPGDATELFLTTAVEMPAEVVAPMRTAPMWQDLEALAPTLAYDICLMGDFSFPKHWSEAITIPTLVIDGGQSHEWRRNTAQKVADALPRGTRLSMDGQPHDVDPDVLGPIIEDFIREFG